MYICKDRKIYLCIYDLCTLKVRITEGMRDKSHFPSARSASSITAAGNVPRCLQQPNALSGSPTWVAKTK